MQERAQPGFAVWALGYFVLMVPVSLAVDWVDARWVTPRPLDWGARLVHAILFAALFAVCMAGLQVWLRRRGGRRAADEKRE